MIRILFVCHGNICRSPMAEFVLKDMVTKRGLANQFYIASAATSTEELGNPVHYGTRDKLRTVGISTAGKYAVRLSAEDYRDYDFLIGMESVNLRNMQRICGHDTDHKMFRLLDFTNKPRDIADPWYTGNFDLTYDHVVEGCEAFLDYLSEKKYIK